MTKTAVCENRIAEYVEVFEKLKRSKPQFAVQKPKVVGGLMNRNGFEVIVPYGNDRRVTRIHH